jgi:hypothetical protein
MDSRAAGRAHPYRVEDKGQQRVPLIDRLAVERFAPCWRAHERHHVQERQRSQHQRDNQQAYREPLHDDTAFPDRIRPARIVTEKAQVQNVARLATPKSAQKDGSAKPGANCPASS